MTGEQIINELVDHAGCDRAATESRSASS